MGAEDIINKYIYGFFILLLGIFIFFGLQEFLNAFLGSVVFYALFKNFMYYLTRRKKLKKSLSAVIIIIISFLIVVLPISVLIGMLFSKGTSLASHPEVMAEYVDKFTNKLKELPFDVSADSIGLKAKTYIAENAGGALSSSLSAVGNILMMYFFLYFLLINMNTMEARIIYFLPFKKSKIMLFGKELVDQTYSNAIGVPLVSIAQGLFAYLCYRIAGVTDAGLWAVLTGFASIIPLVGTAIIWFPVSLFLLANNQIWQGIFVSAYSIIVLSNIDNLVRMVVSKRVGDVHPVITVLGVVMGLKFFGLSGLVFGPLLISYFIILLKLFYMAYGNKTIASPYETQSQMETNVVKLLLNKIGFFNPINQGRKPNQ
jgi:predicted PurR-regulated permease PerM